MTFQFIYFALVLSSMAFLTSCEPKHKDSGSGGAVPDQQASNPENSQLNPVDCMVMINATNQGYSYRQPWNKKNPIYSHGFGVYLGDGLFLTTAGIVRDANFIKMESYDGQGSVTAKVVAIDEEVNLALLKPENGSAEGFLSRLTPLELEKRVDEPGLGDKVQIWQFSKGGLDMVSPGVLESTHFSVPLTYGIPFILYQIKSSVNVVTGGATMPIIKDGKLVGISLMCDTSEQLVLSLPLSALRGFLERVNNPGGYKGIPVMGIAVQELMDPAVRNYLKLPEKNVGAYICKVREQSSAHKAGIRQGDILEHINDNIVDARGIVIDEKLGPVNCSMYVHDLLKVGDIITLGIRRDGQQKAVNVTMDRDGIEKILIPAVETSDNPRYLVYGGLVFQPLNSAFLGAVYKNDPNRMGPEILDIFERENEFVKEGREEVILLTSILPTPATHGYDKYGMAMVDQIDGQIPVNLKHLSTILDAASKKDFIEIRVNKPPYVLFMSPADAIQSNEYIKKAAFPQLKNL